MNHAILVDDRVAVRSQRAPQRHVRIEHAVLIEVHNAQRIRSPDLSRRRLRISQQQAQQRSLAAAVRTDQAHAHAGENREVQLLEELSDRRIV